MPTQDEQVAQVLSAAGICYTTDLLRTEDIGEHVEKYKWKVCFAAGDKAYSSDFFCGDPAGDRRDLEHGRWSAEPSMVTRGKKASRRLAGNDPPSAASVLYYLLSDARLGSDTFEGFCGDLGYSTDSRKALETYLSCQATRHRLPTVLGAQVVSQLEKLLEDY